MSTLTKDPVFDRISRLMREVKAAMDDPDNQTGPTEHPTGDEPGSDDAEPGSQDAVNAQKSEEQTDGGVDSYPDLTPETEPKQVDVQQGDGTPTGEGSYPPVEDRPSDVDTESPASAEFGGKYASDADLATTDLAELFKDMAELGNNIVAGIASGQYPAGAKTASQRNAVNRAAAMGASDVDQLDVIAADVIEGVIKSAQYRADLTARFLAARLEGLSKQALEMDPTSEDVPADTDIPVTDAEDDDAAAAALLAALSGNENGELSPEDEAAVTELLNGNGELSPEDEAVVTELLSALNDESGAVASPGDEATAEELLAALGNSVGEEDLTVEPELAEGEDVLSDMSEQELLEALSTALDEMGESPETLVNAEEPAPKLAAAIRNFRKSASSKPLRDGSKQRKAADYMKNYMRELYTRSKRASSRTNKKRNK